MDPNDAQDQGQDQGGMPPANDQGGMPTTGQDQGMPQAPNGDQGMGDQNGSMPSGGQGYGGDTTPTNEPTTPGEQQPGQEGPTKNEGM